MKKGVFLIERVDAEPQQVQTMLGDQLRAELELKRRGIAPAEFGIHLVSCVAWAAEARLGLTDKPFDEWHTDVIAVTADKEADDEVDPTTKAASNGSA